MPINFETDSFRDHEQFLAMFPFGSGIRLHGETPEVHRFIHHDVNPLSGNVKERIIYAPNDAMRSVHRNFIHALEALNVPLPYATGGIKGGSPARNLRPHVENRFFYLLDLKNAYGQVDMFALSHFLVGEGLSADPVLLEEFLSRYCVTPGEAGLCTGAPASPLLFNLACCELDRRLGLVADEYGLTYTRYLDDLTFSSPDSGDPITRIGQSKRRVIRKVIEEYGLKVNDRKTKSLDLCRAPVVVTGLQLNRSGKWQLPTNYAELIEREFSEVRHRLDYTPQPLDETEWSKLAGRYGLLRSALDPHRGLRTDREREILQLFREIKRIQRIRRHRYNR